MRLVVTALFLVLSAAAAGAQTINVYAPDALGAGLQSDGFGVQLGDSQHGGVYVTIASSDSTLALVAPDENSLGAGTAQNFVPNGTTYLEFVVQALEGVTGDVTLTVSAPGFTDAQDVVTIDVPLFRVVGLDTTTSVIAPDDLFYVQVGRTIGQSWQATDKLRVGGPGATVSFTSSDAGVAELVTTTQSGAAVNVALLGGQATTPVSFAAGGATLSPLAAGSTDITAIIPGFTGLDGGAATVEVAAAALSFTGLPATVGAGLRLGNALTVDLNGTDHGGTTISLVSLDSSRVLISRDASTAGVGALEFQVADGATYAAFHVHAMEGTQGVGLIEATAAGFVTATQGVEVVTPSVEIVGLLDAIDTLDPADPFHVEVGLDYGTGASVIEPQAVRPGAAPLDVALICDDPAVGALATSADYGDTVWVQIAPGSAISSTTVAAGGVAFDGVGAGTALVRPEIAGFLPTSAALRTVTVSQPSLTITNVPYNGIGHGLQWRDAFVLLGAAAHGGTTVRLEVGDPALALVGANTDAVGAAFVDVAVPDGELLAYFDLQALDGVLGTTQVIASAPGFLPDTTSFDLVAPAIEIQGYLTDQSLLPRQSVISAFDDFHARVGVASGPNGVLPQPVRPGSAGIDVTATIDDPLLGRFVSLADTGAVVAVRIEAGEDSTPLAVAGGGFAFDALAAGTATVSVTSPGFAQQPWATRQVLIDPAGFALTGLYGVGAGLVETGVTAQLNGTAHGGTTVHVAVSDPGLALVALPGQAGQPAVDVFVPDGEYLAYFDLHGVDGATGVVTVTASAPGFADETYDENVVQPGVELQYLVANLDVNSAQNVFRARVGVADPGNGYLVYPQRRRPEMPPLVVTVACSDSSVAELVTLAGVGGSRQMEIAPGADVSPYGVSFGGMALRGVGPGTSLVAASIPGFFQIGTAIHEVTVTQNGVALLLVPSALGAGLQSPALVARLNTADHGGTDLRLTTSDAASVLVSGSAAAAGTDTFDVFVPNGVQETVFHLQALEGTAGQVTVSALIDGAVSGYRAMDVVQPAVAITQLADTLSVADGDDAFVVQVGVATPDSSGLAVTQTVRAGGPPLSCPLVLDDGAPADLVTLASTADSLDVAIAPGQFQSGLSVGAGGVALRPVTGGTVVVSARPAGYLAATRTVVVSGDLSAAGEVPLVLALRGNHPNPFNPVTNIAFSLARAGAVRLDVYDVRGRLVRNLVTGRLAAGPHEIAWNGTDAAGRAQASGVYLARLRTDDGVLVHKMALMK